MLWQEGRHESGRCRLHRIDGKKGVALFKASLTRWQRNGGTMSKACNTMKKFLIEFAQACLAAAIIGLPFAIYFWNMKP